MIKKLFFGLIILLSLGCDNRYMDEGHGIQVAFPFEFQIEKSPEHFYVKSVSDITFLISNTHEHKDQTYDIKYTIVGGDGEIFSEGNLTSGNFSMKGNLLKSIGFKPQKMGDHTIFFHASNSREQYDKETFIRFNVENRPFEVSVESVPDIFITETAEIKESLKIVEPDWVKYSWYWKSSENDELKNIDSSLIPKDVPQEIKQNSKIIFSPKGKAGEHILFFAFEDSQKQSVVQNLKINVKNINFETSIEAIEKDVFFGEAVKMAFSLKPEFLSKTNPNKYKLTYYSSDGNIVINGKTLKAGDSMDIKDFPFEKEEFIFIADRFVQNSSVRFVVSDKFGFKKETETSFSLKHIDFTAALEAIEKDVFFGEAVKMAFSLKPEFLSKTNPNKYKLTYYSSDGNIVINGKTLKAGDSMDIKDFPFEKEEFIFIADRFVQNSSVRFVVSDKFGFKKETETSFSLKHIDFTAALEPIKKDIFFNETAKINFSLKPEFLSKTNPNKYTLTYYLDGAEGEINIDGKNLKRGDTMEFKDFPFEKKNVTFTPTKWDTDTPNIRFVISDKFGFKKEISTEIKIKRKEFEASVNKITEEPIEIKSGKKALLELDVRSDTDLKYVFRASSPTNDTGFIFYNGIKYRLNEDIPVVTGKSNFEYLPEFFGSGNHVLSYTVTDITAQTQKNQIQNSTIEIERPPEILSITLTRIEYTESKRPSGHNFKYNYVVSYKARLGKGEKIKSISMEGMNTMGEMESHIQDSTSNLLGEEEKEFLIWVEDWEGGPYFRFWDEDHNSFKITMKTTRDREISVDHVMMGAESR